MSTLDLPIAVIGAGPVGLAAASHLIERGLPVRLYEAGETAAAKRGAMSACSRRGVSTLTRLPPLSLRTRAGVRRRRTISRPAVSSTTPILLRWPKPPASRRRYEPTRASLRSPGMALTRSLAAIGEVTRSRCGSRTQEVNRARSLRAR